MCTFEIHKKDLDLEQFQFECFRNIGDLTEACLQPYIREGLMMLLLSQGKNPSKQEIFTLTFGEAVNRFHQLASLNDLLKPEPWRLSVSQWRNIAQHHSREIVSKDIGVWYGKSPPYSSLTLTRDQAFMVAEEIAFRLRVFKAAKTLFVFDHAREWNAFYPPSASKEKSQEERILDLSVMFAMQKFELIETILTDDKIKISLRDLQPHSDSKRVVHCSQFVVVAWFNFSRCNIEINYFNSIGKHCWSFIAHEDGLKQVVSDTDVDFSRLADYIEFKRVD